MLVGPWLSFIRVFVNVWLQDGQCREILQVRIVEYALLNMFSPADVVVQYAESVNHLDGSGLSISASLSPGAALCSECVGWEVTGSFGNWARYFLCAG